MCRIRFASSLLVVAALTAVTAQERAAPNIAINGVSIPAAAQPRAVVEQQQDAFDTARVRLTGTAGVEYARTIQAGDALVITARALDGAVISIFSGHVVSVALELAAAQPHVVIHAANAVVPPADAGLPVRIRRDGAVDTVRLVELLAGLSASSSLQEVVVVGTDAATGAPLTGSAVAPTIALDGTSAGPFGTTLTVHTDERFSSTDEANGFAFRVLTERTAARVSAEVLTEGAVDIRVGRLVELEGLGTSFNGAYVITGVQHRLGGDSYGGYSTTFRLRRIDLGMFRAPDIDDEVLVAFEAGDPSRPYIVGSWWDCDSTSRTDRSDASSPCRFIRWPW